MRPSFSPLNPATAAADRPPRRLPIAALPWSEIAIIPLIVLVILLG